MPLMSRSHPVQVAVTDSVEDSAAAVMDELRASLTELMTSLSDSISRAVDLERSLRLDKKLAWQVFRLARSRGLSEVGNVPARPSIRRLLQAARRRNVSKRIVDRVDAAFVRFDELAIEHGGDREGLFSILGGRAGTGAEQFDLKVRKAAFRANAHIWGSQARMQVRTLIHQIAPGRKYREDDILISADIDLQRLRQSDPLVMVRWWMVTDVPAEGTAKDTAPPTPVDHSVGLLQDFCTRPLPRMIPRKDADGSVETELVIGAGRSAAVTLYSSQLFENVADRPQAAYFGQMFVTIPSETAVWELLVPAGKTDPATARSIVYGRRSHPERVSEDRAADLLPQRGTVSYLGPLESVPPLEDAPNHAEAVRHVLQTHGWLGTRFDVYRSVVKYPALHTMLCLKVDAARR
jgi:hypothetical protein